MMKSNQVVVKTVDIAVTGRLRNGKLWEAVKQHGSACKVAQLLEISPSRFGTFLNLQASPSQRWMEKKAELIVRTLGYLPEDIWPEAFRNKKLLKAKKVFEKRIEMPEDTLFLSCNPLLTTEHLAEEPPVDPEGVIDRALERMRPIQRFVITKRFGLDGEGMTLEECGNALGISRTRVQQIETKALRALRHPRLHREIQELRHR